VSDPTGRAWSVNAITRTCAVETLLTMGTFTAVAWRRVLSLKKLPTYSDLKRSGIVPHEPDGTEHPSKFYDGSE